jgi:uncharacterized membrane protein YdjX (TVP38/TMEM64 family)
MSQTIVKPLVLLTLLLAVPILPFLIFGAQLEPWVESLLNEPKTPFSNLTATAWIVGLLSTDILLPIPSSAVCTFAGKALGGFWGTVVSWIGLNFSAAVGYWLGSRFGLPMVKRFSDETTLSRIEQFDLRSSVVCLALCRGLPVVAEASVMFMGIKRLSWRVFWPTILLSNLGLASAYSLLGHFSEKAAWFPLALAISLAIPVIFFVYWRLRKSK